MDTLDYLATLSVEELRKKGIPASYEQKYGIGAQDDGTVSNYEAIQSSLGDDQPWYEAGEVYCIALRGANKMRKRAFAFQFGDCDVKSWATSWT